MLMWNAPITLGLILAQTGVMPHSFANCTSTPAKSTLSELRIESKPPITVSPAAGVERDSMWLTRANVVSASCASKAEAYHLERLLFSGGTALKVPADGGTLTLTQGPLDLPDPPRKPPLLYNTAPLAAALVVRRSLADGNAFIGVWRRGQNSVLASFIDGSNAPPRVMAAIDAKVKGLTFFPGVDTPGGSIGLLMRRDDTWVVANLSWSHRNWTW